MPSVTRLTLFKIPDPAYVEKAIHVYSTLGQDAVKDGKPYMQLSQAYATHADPRNQGVTLVARQVFESKADMDYYDNECTAHDQLKAALKGGVEGPPQVLYMDS